MDFENEQMSIVTLRDIQVGEELYINYNADNDSEQPVWFNAV
jgi:SET domain-containing protein